MTMTRRRSRFAAHINGMGQEVSEVGGKAAGLDLLIKHGYPVPATSVITTAAYRAATAERSLGLLIEDLRSSPPPSPDLIPAESAAIERTFLAAPVSDEVTAAIAKIGSELLRNGPVAVRSSATAEDLADASFAGQYLTITGVSGIADLQVAVRRCWASLWMPAARAYRRRQHVAERHIAMAVIIQTMVDPIWSGVAFSRDPQGENHLVRVEAVPGLGEDLVSGKVTPADYLIRRDTLEITPTGDAADLDFVEDLARMALRIEEIAGTPQDIEWAYTAAGVALLQVRPITVIGRSPELEDGLDTHNPQAHTFTPHGVVEMLPGVVPPLLWSINSPMLDNAFRSTFDNLGGVTPDQDCPIVTRFRGRAALDLTAISDIAKSLPGGDPAEVERQYLGKSLDHEPAGHTDGGFHPLAALRSRRVHNRIVDEVDLTATAATALARMQLDLAELPVRLLTAYRQRIRDLAWRGYAAEVGASSAAGATYRALELLLERWLATNEAASWAQLLTRGALDHSPVGAARARGIEDVLSRFGTEPIRQILSRTDQPTRKQLAEHGPDGEQFLATLDGAVRLLGSKSIYGDETWAEDEAWIWRQLGMLVRGEAQRAANRPPWEEDYADLCARLATDKRWRLIRILTGQFIDFRLRWLKRQVEETIRFLELRERAKNALLVLGGEERRIIVEAAGRLVASRRLSRPDLVRYLTDAELEQMLFGACGVESAGIETRVQACRRYTKMGPLPDWFVGHPDTSPIPEIPASGDRLTGWAASPGSVQGTVRIISSLTDGTRLQQGEVLVAHATDPSWTPLFLVAGAVVLEMGGPLSHAAIVAREFGLPAVLNVPQATRVLRDGEMVLVDGTLGIVDHIAEEAQP
jgi:phosphohistidine swiveling domain-containing protein